MPKIKNTYTRWVITSIMPATGWQVVWHDEHNQHFYTPLEALGLGVERTYDATTGQRILDPPSYRMSEDECWEIVGLDYDLGGTGFSVVNECGNYCGLIPPHISVDVWEEANTCHMPAQQESPHA